MKFDSEVIDFVNLMNHYMDNKDEEGLKQLLEEGQEQKVALADAGVAVIQIVSGMTDYVVNLVASSVQLTEERLRTVVGSLDSATQERVTAAFKKAEDDLLENGNEENNND